MISKLTQITLVFLCIFTTTACGIKYNVRGRVVEAETGKPVVGAAVGVKWYTHHIMPRLIGLTSGYERIADYGALTDADGYFEIKRHLFRDHNLGVYKRGYICWNSDTIFKPKGKNFNEMFVPREDFSFGDGMVIELEPFKEHYPKYEHAHFATTVNTNCGSDRIFSDAIRYEEIIVRKKIRGELK